MATAMDIRNKIAELMTSVTDIGRVHAYERYAKNESALKQFYLHQGHLRGWFIRRVRVQRRSQAIGRWTVTTRWQIRGFLSLNDESQTEMILDDLVDQLMAVFQTNEELDGLVDTTVVGEEAGLQLEDSGPYVFAGVLSHGVRLALVTRHCE